MHKKLAFAGFALAAFVAVPAQALDLRPDSAFVSGARAAQRDTTMAMLGVGWQWDWRKPLWGTELTGTTEAFIARWDYDAFGGGSSTATQIGLVPVFRFRFADGTSPWYVEGGIGVTWMDRIYRTPDRQFSTSGQFMDVLGVGRSFGAQREHELSLRITHVSNADIKKPNPGEDFLQLRYTRRF